MCEPSTWIDLNSEKTSGWTMATAWEGEFGGKEGDAKRDMKAAAIEIGI